MEKINDYASKITKLILKIGAITGLLIGLYFSLKEDIENKTPIHQMDVDSLIQVIDSTKLDTNAVK